MQRDTTAAAIRREPEELASWRASLANAVERRGVVLTRQPLSTDATELLECDIELAVLSSLFDDRRLDTAAAVARGAGAAAAAALCQRKREGTVPLAEPGRAIREIPTGDAALTPALWRDGVALACLARDRDALEVLCASDTIAACQLRPDRADAFWLEYSLAIASTVTDPAACAAHARAAEVLMRDARIVSPAVLDQLDRPVLELARRLALGDTEDWNDAVAAALEKHRAFYEAPARRHDRSGFLALGIMGLCALAHDCGVQTRVQSPYLSLDLVRGTAAAELSKVVYRYAPRLISEAEEATWFLDLAGFPRASRSHRLIQTEHGLIARYDAHGAPGLPHAQADLVLAEDGDPQATGNRAAVPPALDAGELLWLAERFATEAGNERLPRAERRARLSEAIACIDTILNRLSPTERAVEPRTVRSERGRALFAAERGRFERDRLAAYRDALARQLQRFDRGSR
jgi:hypothetical protein